MRSRPLVVALTLSCFVWSGVACKSRDKASARGQSSIPLSVFAADSEVMLGFSFPSLRESYIYTKYLKDLIAKLPESSDSEYGDFVASCGFDPLEKVDTFLAAGHSGTEKFIVAISGFSKQPAMDCLQKLAPGQQSPSIEMVGELIHIRDEEEQVWAGWHGDILVVGSPAVDKEYLVARLAGTDALKASDELVTLATGSNPQATLWMAVVPQEGTPLAMDVAESAGFPKPKGMSGSVALSEGFRFKMAVQFSKDEEAERALAMAKGGLEMVKPEDEFERAIFDRLKLEQSGAKVVFDFKVSSQDIDGVVSKAQELLGSLFEL